MTTERIAELEAALEGQKQKVAILDNMVKERDRQIATVTANVNLWKEAAGQEADGLESWKNEAQRLTTERGLYREALEKIGHQAEKCRMWNGLMWIYHPPAVASIRKIAREARDGKG